MIAADHPRQPVLLALLLPQHEELADAIGRVLADRRFGHVAEGVLAELDRTVVLQRIDLQTRRHEPAFDLVTNIVLDRGDEIRFTDAQTALI